MQDAGSRVLEVKRIRSKITVCRMMGSRVPWSKVFVCRVLGSRMLGS